VDLKRPVIHALSSNNGTSSCHSSQTLSGGGHSSNMPPGQRPHLSGNAQDRSMACGASPTLSASSTASTFGGGSERMSQDANEQQLIALRASCLASPSSRATNLLALDAGSPSSARCGLVWGSRATGAGMSGYGSLTARHGAAGSANLNSKERAAARDGMHVRFAAQPIDSNASGSRFAGQPIDSDASSSRFVGQPIDSDASSSRFVCQPIDSDAFSSRPLDSGMGLAFQHMAEEAEPGYHTLAQLTNFRIWRNLPNVKPTEREI